MQASSSRYRPAMLQEMQRQHLASAGEWPPSFPLTAVGKVCEGLVVRSISGRIEGCTTGARLQWSSTSCPGWFIGVSWETGERQRPCSQGWHYDSASRAVRITGGGDITQGGTTPRLALVLGQGAAPATAKATAAPQRVGG